MGASQKQLFFSFTNDIDTSKNNGPLALTNLTESEERSENAVIVAASEDLVGGDGGGVHPKHCQDDTDKNTNTEDGSEEDDNDHDVVSSNIFCDRQQQGRHKHYTGAHHGHSVKSTGQEVGHPIYIKKFVCILE